MQLTIQQKVFSLREAFAIMDGEGNKLYEVKGKILSIGHKLTVSELDENPVMHIHQKVLSLVPKYFLEPEGGEEVELKGHITLLKPHYTLELPGGDWEIRGDFTAHEYEITCGDRLVAAVHQQWFSWGDCYELTVNDDADAMLALGVMLAIDCVDADTRRGAADTTARAAQN